MLIIAGAHAVNNFLKKLIRSQLCVCVLFQFNKLHHTEKFVCNIQSLPVCILVYLKYIYIYSTPPFEAQKFLQILDFVLTKEKLQRNAIKFLYLRKHIFPFRALC